MTPRELPATSPFSGDDGSADPVVTAVLDDVAAGRLPLVDALAQLRTARVLVPVVSGAAPADPASAHDSCSDGGSAVVGVRGPDGRTGLPVFSSTQAMARWSSEPRCVPSLLPAAAASAIAEGWDLMVIDPAGPATVVLGRPVVLAVASGAPWRPAVQGGAVIPALVAAIGLAVRDAASQLAASGHRAAGLMLGGVLPGRSSEVRVELQLPAALDADERASAVAAVSAALAAASPVAELVDSLEIGVTATAPETAG